MAEIDREERGNLISVFNSQLSTDYNWQESLYTKLRIGDWNYLIQCVSHLCIGVDLALLSLANHSIISYGTFAMWGAFLSNKGEVVMPKDHIHTDVGQRIKMANISNWKFL